MNYDNRGFKKGWSEYGSYQSHLNEQYELYCAQLHAANALLPDPDDHEYPISLTRWINDECSNNE